MKNHIRTSLVASALALPVFGAIPAHAVEDTVYPAIMCLEEGIDTGAFNRSEYRITRTGVGNGTGRLLCPIARMTCGTSYDSGFGDPVRATGFRAYVHTYRTENSGDLGCRLISKNYDGSTIHLGDTGFAPPGQNEMEIYTTSSCRSFYILSCTMPQNTSTTYAKIFAYQVRE